MSVNDRFLFFLREKKITQKEFCEKTGYGVQSLSKFLSGNTGNPGVNLFILTSKHFPEVNINWLMVGEGDMWNAEYVKLGNKKEDIKVSASGMVYVGEGMDSKLVNELIETQAQLVESQKKQIEQLEREIDRLKGK